MNSDAACPATPETLAGKAILSMALMDRLVKRAKSPDFDMAEWNALAALYDTAVFQRIAANRDARGWDEDLRLRHDYALTCGFEYDIRRMAEIGRTVFMDVIETIITPHERFSINTLGVIEFDPAARIRRTTTYQQWDPGRVPRHLAQND